MHVTDADLLAWRDHPTDDLRARVVSHLALCNDCAARYAALVRDAPAAEMIPEHWDPAAFIARGLDVRAARPDRRILRWSLIAASAAAMVFAVVFVTNRGKTDDPTTGVTRGGAGFQVAAPIGDVPDAAEFSWTTAGGGPFRVEINDAGGQVIYTTRVSDTRLTLPADVRARLLPGTEYRWSVSRLNTRGETIDVTPLTAFRITR